MQIQILGFASKLKIWFVDFTYFVPSIFFILLFRHRVKSSNNLWNNSMKKLETFAWGVPVTPCPCSSLASSTSYLSLAVAGKSHTSEADAHLPPATFVLALVDSTLLISRGVLLHSFHNFLYEGQGPMQSFKDNKT